MFQQIYKVKKLIDFISGGLSQNAVEATHSGVLWHSCASRTWEIRLYEHIEQWNKAQDIIFKKNEKT